MKRFLKSAAVVLMVSWAAWMTSVQFGSSDEHHVLGSTGIGGPLAPFVPFHGTTNGSGLSGSGVPSNPLMVNEGSGLTWCAGAACTNAGSGLTYSSGALIVNAGSGLAYDTGTIRSNVNAYNQNYYVYRNEWDIRTCVNTSILGIWEATSNGTGATPCTANSAGVAGRPGIEDVNMGSASNSRAAWSTSQSGYVFNSGDTYTMDVVVGVENTSSSTDGYATWWGFGDTVTAVNQTNACMFLYDERQAASAPTTGSRSPAGTQALNCYCSAAGVRTEYPIDGSTVSDASFTTVAYTVGAVTWSSNTNVMHLKVVVTGTSEADFYINGTLSCKITSHIPTGGTGAIMAGLRSVSSNIDRLWDIDYSELSWVLGSTRSP